MIVPSAANMVNGQKFNVGFAATFTRWMRTTIESKDGSALAGLMFPIVFESRFPMSFKITPRKFPVIFFMSKAILFFFFSDLLYVFNPICPLICFCGNGILCAFFSHPLPSAFSFFF